MSMTKKIFAGLFTALAVLCLIATISNSLDLQKQRAQLGRMHTLALQHRSYGSPSQWKHDERVIQHRIDQLTSSRSFNIAGIVIFGIIGLAILGRDLAYVRFPRRPLPLSYRPAPYRPSAYGPSPPSPVVDPQIEFYRKKQLEPDLATKKHLAGDEGQRLVGDCLRALPEGWDILGEKTDLFYPDGGRAGDVDFVVRSPRGIGFAIDAKNQYVKVWLDRTRKVIVFSNRWWGRRDEYPTSRAWFLADLAHAHFKFPGNPKKPGQRLTPMMCFTEKADLKLPGFRGHFPLCGEGSTHGQKTPSVLPIGLPA